VNKQSPKRPVPHEDDLVSLSLISPEERQRIAEDLKKEKAREQRRERRKRLFSATSVVILVTAVIAEAVAISTMLPLQKVIPLIVYQKDDGTVSNYIEWNDLPAQVKNDTTVNVVWQYVQYRESWSKGNAPLAYDVVSAMSSPDVRDSFQGWFNADNPNSPQRLYGDGTVQARYVNWTSVCPEEGCSGPPMAYRFWFDRIETRPGGQPGPAVRHAVTVRIARDVPLPADRMSWRWTFNAPLIQVVEYPGAQREGVAR
jgi:type IV secretory pathway component VirB8